MHFTGTVESVRAEVITDLLDSGVTPVVAPVSLGETTNYNLNADPVAGALARAINARRAVFISNVAGVLVDGSRVDFLTETEARELMADGVIHGGMIPKVESALLLLAAGVPAVTITDLAGWVESGGTTFLSEEKALTSRGAA